MDHIVLIGMPGSGKSTIARRLSGILSLPFLDGDTEIEKRTGETLSATIARIGLQGFLRLKEQRLLSLSLAVTVFAPGGSSVYSPAAMSYMKSNALTIYLEVPLKDLQNRTGSLEKRGVVIRNGQSFEDLYRERVPLYLQYADLTLDARNLSADEVLERLLPQITSLGIARS
jgi:shikimate kinase